jgi:hypothetical protein
VSIERGFTGMVQNVQADQATIQIAVVNDAHILSIVFRCRSSMQGRRFQGLQRRTCFWLPRPDLN